MDKLTGRLQVPGDKSITHRALIFSALARGRCHLRGVSPAADCLNTAGCLSWLGITIEISGRTATPSPASLPYEMWLDSPGLNQLKAPDTVLDAGNSGTTMRVLSGLLAGQPFESRLDGDSSLRRRPMARVLAPLQKMGAIVKFHERDGCAPFSISGGDLRGIEFSSTIASAQVQTAVILAGLQAEGKTTLRVDDNVRDHTLRMLQYIGVPLNRTGETLAVSKLSEALPPFDIEIPSDISSAAFFMVAAACLPGSALTLLNLGVNPGRRLVIDVLRRMGAQIEETNARIACGEPVADVVVRYSDRLHGATISGAEIPAGIDEIPILALAGALCDGKLSVTGAGELRVKESDRIKAIVTNIEAIGGRIREHGDGFEIDGQSNLPGGSTWLAYDDHRLAMSGSIASLLCDKPVVVDNPACASVSYPTFQEDLHRVVSG